ncbi:MAG: ferrous iron transport protein B [Oscillospiraceae bacterium]
MEQTKTIALLGQPNSGKSTIFNALTGAHQHVGNWPGKTVEKKEGSFTYNGVTYNVADLPGSYSLSANSDEEIVTRDYIASGKAELVCLLADSSQLERSLFMLADYAGINTPAMLILTMTDVAEQKGITVNTEKLSEKLGIPVVGLVAPDRKNYGDFFTALEQALREPQYINASTLFELYDENEIYKEAISLVPADGIRQYSDKWLGAKLSEGDKAVIKMLDGKADKFKLNQISEKAEQGSIFTSDCKFEWIDYILEGAVTKNGSASAALTKFDRAAISRRWGKLIAVGIILLGLVGSMVVAAPIMGIGTAITAPLSSLVTSLLSGAPEWVSDLICNTLILSLGWVISMLGFVFGINLVFGYIEEVGYMARISYAFDNTMSKLGLQGKSMMPLLVGFGCTIGGAAGTRVIDSWGQKVLTIAMVWAVPCGATFAVIPTLASAFFGWGGILVMLLLFAIMFLHITITAKIFGRKLSPKEERTGLIMELPPYHKPKWRALFRRTLNNVWEVFKKAFFVVFSVSVVFWLLSYSADGIAANSILYKVGVAIEPVTRFFGMGWQAFLAFVSSMVSKEAVLGVLSALFADSGTIFQSTTGAAAADANIAEILTTVMSKAEALALIIAVTFNVPCLMAVASTYQESHSLKWTLRIAAYYIVTALLLSCITYHIAALFM